MSRVASPPVLWSLKSAYERAVQAVRYLAENYPECGRIEALDPYHDAVYEEAAREDWGVYVDALRNYMRAGRRAAPALEPFYIPRAVKKIWGRRVGWDRYSSSASCGGALGRSSTSAPLLFEPLARGRGE